jgi:hypothetical protein
VNLAPTQGVGGPGLLGTCVVSDSLVPQLGSSSAPGQLRLEQAANVEGAGQSSSAPDPWPLGRRVYIPMARKTLLEMLSESAKSGRAPLSHDILTWMDAEHPQAEVNKHYMDSSSDFQAFGIHDAFDIMESNICHLATFGELGQGGAMRLRKYTRNKILIPLDLWATNTEFTGTGTDHLSTILKWQDDVEGGYIEDIDDPENIEEVKVEEVEEAEEAEEEFNGESSDIEEIFDWNTGKFVGPSSEKEV